MRQLGTNRKQRGARIHFPLPCGHRDSSTYCLQTYFLTLPRTPLMFAASLGDCETVKLLLKHGAAVNDFASPHDWNPLCAAIQANNKDIVRLLLHVPCFDNRIAHPHCRCSPVAPRLVQISLSSRRGILHLQKFTSLGCNFL